MNVRRCDNLEDFKLIESWWEDRIKVKDLHRVFSAFGYLAETDEGKPIGSMFLYPVLACEVALIGWPCTSPDSTADERDLALEVLFDVLHEEAKRSGYKFMWTMSGVPPMQKRFLEQGYVVGDTNINQYWKEL